MYTILFCLQPTRVNTVPFFWSMQYGKSLRYAGHLAGGTYDDVIVVGSLEDVDSAKFVAYYMQGDTVAAVASLMRDPVAADFANLALEGKALTRTEATDPDETWRNKYSLLAKAWKPLTTRSSMNREKVLVSLPTIIFFFGRNEKKNTFISDVFK